MSASQHQTNRNDVVSNLRNQRTQIRQIRNQK